MSKPQEWDWPRDERRFREEYRRFVDDVPQRRPSWASRYTRAYLRFLVLILKLVAGAICGVVLLLIALVFKALLIGP